MIVTLLGKRWRLIFGPLGRHRTDDGGRVDGWCDDPSRPRKSILIDSRLSGQRELDVLLHEMMHACDWAKDEEFITRQATDIAKVLWKLGYRRISNNGK